MRAGGEDGTKGAQLTLQEVVDHRLSVEGVVATTRSESDQWPRKEDPSHACQASGENARYLCDPGWSGRTGFYVLPRESGATRRLLSLRVSQSWPAFEDSIHLQSADWRTTGRRVHTIRRFALAAFGRTAFTAEFARSP
jgi:hypothetical protein